MKKWVYAAVTIALLGVIFFFSAQSGAQSYALSAGVTDKMAAEHLSQTLPAWFSVASVHANLRKWAHVLLYLLLGISSFLSAEAFLPGSVSGYARLRHAAWMTALFCTACAAGDEIHQFFVPGRSALPMDVAVDAIGFLPGIAIAGLLLWVWRYVHHNKQRPSE